MGHLCQITLNRKLSCKFEKWCKFSSQVKSCKKELCKLRPTCTTFLDIKNSKLSKIYHQLSITIYIKNVKMAANMMYMVGFNSFGSLKTFQIYEYGPIS
jgi:uncharacterized protein (UPF0276 family)